MQVNLRKSWTYIRNGWQVRKAGCGADLQGADLRGADLDFASIHLSGNFLKVKLDARIVRQLLYHAASNCDPDDPECQKIKDLIKEEANKFHRADECGRI